MRRARLLDGVDLRNARHSLGGNRRIAALGDLEELAPQVAPAEGDGDPVRRQLLVGGIAVALHDAAIVGEQLVEMLAASPRRVGIDHSRRIGAAPGPVIARDRPEVAGLRLTTPRIEHRHRRLIDRQFGGGEEIGLEPFVKRHQLRRCITDPERQCRAVEIEALGGQHFGLAVQRKVPAIFGHQHRGDHGFGRQSGFDQMLWRRRLHDPLAGPAGEPGPVRDNHSVLGAAPSP